MSMLRSPLGAPVRPLARKVTEAGGGVIIPGGQRIAYLGDSITLAGRHATNYESLQRGYSAWADILSGKRARLEWADNYGVSGERTDQIAARVSSVVASGARACVVLAGTNDVSQGVSAATIISNLSGIYTGLQNAGIWVIGVPILPRGGAAALTAGQLSVVNEVNTWIRARGGRFRLADPVADMDDGSGNHAPIAGMTPDGLHLTARGAYTVAKKVARQIESLYGADAGLSNLGSLVVNPRFSGAGGTKNGGALGTVADSWLVSATNAGGATVTASKVTDSDGTVWQRVTVSGTYTGTGRSFYLYQFLTAGNFLAGERAAAFARVRCGGSFVGCAPPRLEFTTDVKSIDHVSAALADPSPTEAWQGRFRTFPKTLAANSTSPLILFNVAMPDTATTDPISGYFEIAEVGVHKY